MIGAAASARPRSARKALYVRASRSWGVVNAVGLARRRPSRAWLSRSSAPARSPRSPTVSLMRARTISRISASGTAGAPDGLRVSVMSFSPGSGGSSEGFAAQPLQPALELAGEQGGALWGLGGLERVPGDDPQRFVAFEVARCVEGRAGPVRQLRQCLWAGLPRVGELGERPAAERAHRHPGAEVRELAQERQA